MINFSGYLTNGVSVILLLILVFGIVVFIRQVWKEENVSRLSKVKKTIFGLIAIGIVISAIAI